MNEIFIFDKKKGKFNYIWSENGTVIMLIITDNDLLD